MSDDSNKWKLVIFIYNINDLHLLKKKNIKFIMEYYTYIYINIKEGKTYHYSSLFIIITIDI